MAKKAAKTKVGAKAAPPLKGKGRPKLANPKGRRPILLTIRGGPEWERWFDELREEVAKRKGLGSLSRAGLFDAMVVAFIEKEGMSGPPSRIPGGTTS